MGQAKKDSTAKNNAVELERTIDTNASELAQYDGVLKSMGSRQTDPKASSMYSEYSTLVEKPLSAAVGSAPPPNTPVETQSAVITPPPSPGRVSQLGQFKSKEASENNSPAAPSEDDTERNRPGM